MALEKKQGVSNLELMCEELLEEERAREQRQEKKRQRKKKKKAKSGQLSLQDSGKKENVSLDDEDEEICNNVSLFPWYNFRLLHFFFKEQKCRCGHGLVSLIVCL